MLKNTLTCCVLVLAFLAIAVENNVFASSRAGNGGYVVKCTDFQGKASYEVLDYFEARTRRKIKIDLGEPDLSVEEKIELALKRLDQYDPERSARYRAKAKGFLNQYMYLTQQDLPDTGDSHDDPLYLKDKNCIKMQIAVQINPNERQFPEDPYYYVKEELWNVLDNTQKAGLVLHEIIYNEAIYQNDRPHENSVAVRYFNSYISSGKVSLIKNNSDYFEFIKDKIKFTRYVLGGLDILSGAWKATKPLQLHENGNISGIHFFKDIRESVQTLLLFGKPANVKFVDFYENGTIKSIGLNSFFETPIYPQLSVTEDGETAWGKGSVEVSGTVHFYASGSLQSACARFGQEFVSTSYHIQIAYSPRHMDRFDCPQNVRFHENGVVEWARVLATLIDGAAIPMISIWSGDEKKFIRTDKETEILEYNTLFWANSNDNRSYLVEEINFDKNGSIVGSYRTVK